MIITSNTNSLKQLFQEMIPKELEIMEGTVIADSPLKIQMTNDAKLIITDRITIVPRHLSDYKTEATFSFDPAIKNSSLQSKTKKDEIPGNYEEKDGKHIHQLDTYLLQHGKLTVYNALKKDDKVYVLSINNGKLYYVLDRVVE